MCTVDCQAPLSMGFPRQEYWTGLPFLSPGDLLNPGIEPASPALADRFFTTEPLRKTHFIDTKLITKQHNLGLKQLFHWVMLPCWKQKKFYYGNIFIYPTTFRITNLGLNSFFFSMLNELWLWISCQCFMWTHLWLSLLSSYFIEQKGRYLIPRWCIFTKN